MPKIPEELKLKIVKEYLSHAQGMMFLSKKYDISVSSIKEWIVQYKTFGSFIKARQFYTTEFKLKVLNYQQKSHLSDTKIMLMFKLPHRALVKNWRKLYLTGGIKAISGTKGRPRIMPRSVIPDKPREEWTKEEELAALKAENLYLKKLWALIQEEEKQKMAKSQEDLQPAKN